MSYPIHKAIQFLTPTSINASSSGKLALDNFVVLHANDPARLSLINPENVLIIGSKSNITVNNGPIRGKLIDIRSEDVQLVETDDLVFLQYESAKSLIKILKTAILNKLFEKNPRIILVLYNSDMVPQVLSGLSKDVPNLNALLRKHFYCISSCWDEDFVRYLLSKFSEDNLLLECNTNVDISTVLPNISALVKQKIFVRNAADLLNLKTDPLFKKWKYDRNKVTVIDSPATQLLSSNIRVKDADCFKFVRFGNRLMRLLAEETLARLPSVGFKTLTSPTGQFIGLHDSGNMKLCVVSIIRSGDILLEAFKQLIPDVSIGKILIQRDESTSDKRPVFYYRKLPSTISKCFCLVVDPMLGTGGSVTCAIKCLVDSGVHPSNILFVNVYAAEEGLERLYREYPDVRTVTLSIDEYLNHDKYLVPGVGDFGDRYYGTQE